MSINFSKPGPKPCIICKTLLEEVFENDIPWKNIQPLDGGEVNFIFAFGSMKFDNSIGATTFKGVICDDCAESLMERLQ